MTCELGIYRGLPILWSHNGWRIPCNPLGLVYSVHTGSAMAEDVFFREKLDIHRFGAVCLLGFRVQVLGLWCFVNGNAEHHNITRDDLLDPRSQVSVSSPQSPSDNSCRKISIKKNNSS